MFDFKKIKRPGQSQELLYNHRNDSLCDLVTMSPFVLPTVLWRGHAQTVRNGASSTAQA